MKEKKKLSCKSEKKVDYIFNGRYEAQKSFSAAKRIPKQAHFAIK